MANLTQEQFAEAIARLFSLGARIEELFVQQYDRIGFHNDDERNDYRIQEARLSTAMLDKGLTDEVHKQHAEAILKLTDNYKEGFLRTLSSLNEEIKRELGNFEKGLNAVADNIADADLLESLRRWLDLSADLYVARFMATRSVSMRVEFDRTLPNLIIGHNGRADVTLTVEETQAFQSRLTEMAELLEQSHKDNERIQAERLPLSALFSNTREPAHRAEHAVAPNAIAPSLPKIHPLEGKSWFRFVKVVYFCLWLAAAAFCVIAAVIEADASFIFGSAVVLVVTLIVLRKGFYYVTLGRTTAVEPPGTVFFDLDELRNDFADVLASSPEMYQTVVAPFFESWKSQYGRRVPIQAFNTLRKRVDAELESLQSQKQRVIDEAAKKGETLHLAKLRDQMETVKAEYEGPSRPEFVRAIDDWIIQLEAKYGTAIPIAEASKMLDELETKNRERKQNPLR